MIAAIIGALGLLGTVIASVKNLFGGSSSASGTSLADVITRDITNDAATLADYEAGQAIVVADISIPGDDAKAVLVAMKAGGPAYQDIFGGGS